jgi:hypothetical protein
MTSHQDKAVWELCRQGLHGVAAQAEAAWAQGRGFAPQDSVPLARTVRELIRIANRETRQSAQPGWDVAARRSAPWHTEVQAA